MIHSYQYNVPLITEGKVTLRKKKPAAEENSKRTFIKMSIPKALANRSTDDKTQHGRLLPAARNFGTKSRGALNLFGPAAPMLPFRFSINNGVPVGDTLTLGSSCSWKHVY
jgi:hypothetical protein